MAQQAVPGVPVGLPGGWPAFDEGATRPAVVAAPR
jgi:hypothetical protein